MAENNCGYWVYSGSGEAPAEPRIFTRAEKGQALTHLEMDFNLASLLHKVETSSISSSSVEVDHKPTREEEMEGMYATFSYAPIVNGTESLVQNSPIVVKVQHTTDEILYKVSNETIPGTLNVSGTFTADQDCIVSGNLKALNDTETNTLGVVENANISGSLRVEGTASFQDVNIEGNLYVNGVMFGNLSNPAYNTPNYAQPYSRQSDAALKENKLLICNPLDKLSLIRGYEFDWSPKAEQSGHDIGLIAQEVQAVYPEVVSEGKDGYLRVAYDKLVPVLIEAIKELSWEIDILKCQIKDQNQI